MKIGRLMYTHVFPEIVLVLQNLQLGKFLAARSADFRTEVTIAFKQNQTR